MGDPSAWSRACAALEAVRAAARPRGARLIVAIVQVTAAMVLRQRRAMGSSSSMGLQKLSMHVSVAAAPSRRASFG